MQQAALVVALVLLVLGSPLVVLTGIGAHRRGNSTPLALVAGLAYPVTWAVWYVRDRQP